MYDEKRIQIPLEIYFFSFSSSMQEKHDEMFEQGMITTAHPKISASGFIS